MVSETLLKLCIATRFCAKIFFAPKHGEMDQKWTKIGYFEFKEKFGH